MILDVPFCLAIPNGCYRVFDPVKQMAIIQTTLREGSRTFFRNMPIIGPTLFTDLKSKARDFERPREEYSYLITSKLTDGTQKATLNIHCGTDGGFAETKYYSEIQITFIEDDVSVVGSKDEHVLRRATEVLNPFLDKYRLLTEDYRVSHVSSERNFYFATCHTSPLTLAERQLTVAELLASLVNGRTFFANSGTAEQTL